MNAHDSLLDNFSNMHDELNSSNNRMSRMIVEIFYNEIKDLESSLDYFNGEYLLVDKRNLRLLVDKFRKHLIEIEFAHFERYKKNFSKEVDFLRPTMCNFFDKKMNKDGCDKKKMSSGIKKVVGKMCDFNFIGFEEELNNPIYDFKVNFEINFIRDENCKDDFNKIIRSFEHSLLDKLRSEIAYSAAEKQEIVSRYAAKGNEIVRAFKTKKR